MRSYIYKRLVAVHNVIEQLLFRPKALFPKLHFISALSHIVGGDYDSEFRACDRVQTP